jgi:hypothetical protein
MSGKQSSGNNNGDDSVNNIGNTTVSVIDDSNRVIGKHVDSHDTHINKKFSSLQSR